MEQPAQSLTIAKVSYPEACSDLRDESPRCIDQYLGERLQENEAAVAQEIIAETEEQVRRAYAGKRPAKRDAHPKSHGCVQAKFTVFPRLPDDLPRTDVFQPGKSYDAWIRFSNGNPNPDRPDSAGDVRGMAIKLLGVPGPKSLESDADAMTQDFILINHPVFFLDDVQRYLSFTKAVGGTNVWQLLFLPFDLGFKGSAIVAKMATIKIGNPLHEIYYSMLAYRFGSGASRRAVKYKAIPRLNPRYFDEVPPVCSPSDEKLCAANQNVSHCQCPNYLRQAMVRTFNKMNGQGDFQMEFAVQVDHSRTLKVEDTQTLWDEAKTPFVSIARIDIPAQDFDTPERNEFCENLSFNPWHSLPEHKPLGAVNRLRKVIYDHISNVRHGMNKVPRTEP